MRRALRITLFIAVIALFTSNYSFGVAVEDGLRDASIERIVAYVNAEEIRRLKLDQSWVHVVVDQQPAAKLMDLSFYRSYNRLSEPAVIYVVAVDCAGRLHEIAGFKSSEYSELARQWLQRRGHLSRKDTLKIFAGYFELVEGWRPGLVESGDTLQNVPAAQAALRNCSSCVKESLPGIVSAGANKQIVRALLFDKRSGRLEYVEADLSAASGINVTSRRVLIDNQRIEF